MDSIIVPMGKFTKVNLNKIRSVAKVESLSPTATVMKGIGLMIKNKDMGSTIGLAVTYTKANSNKIRGEDLVNTFKPTAIVTKVVGLMI